MKWAVYGFTQCMAEEAVVSHDLMSETCCFATPIMCQKEPVYFSLPWKQSELRVRNIKTKMKGVQKVSRIKLYIPTQKWTMNEALIFFS